MAATALAYTEAQANNGRRLYINNCAACHGMDLRGGTVPKQFPAHAGDEAFPLAGPGRLPGFFSAGQIYSYSRSTMPQQNPGSLTTEEYLDLTAFLVMVNRLAEPDGAPATTEALEKIRIPHSR
ncbi:MAG: c-type cytochrome [Myxococcales bacterium]